MAPTKRAFRLTDATANLHAQKGSISSEALHCFPEIPLNRSGHALG